MFGWLKEKPRPARASLLGAVPVRNELVRAVRAADTADGRALDAVAIRLTAPLAASRLRRMVSGARAKGEKTFELDELGAFVWDALDGRRTVESLIRHFAETQRVNVREAEVAVLAFLKTLAQRNLIALAVNEDAAKAGRGAKKRKGKSSRT